MSSVLNNFVTIRKTRGDILRPAEFRTIVDMIRGILKQYNYSGFNQSYQDFLNHLVNYNDPHHDTDTSFYAEIVERVYSIYSKMTASPISYEEFQETIVNSVSFLELIRRIILNGYLYDSIRRADGSVPASVTVTLTEDWGRSVLPNIPVTIDFGTDLVDEDAFLQRGWNNNSTPIPVVLNADDLAFEYNQNSIVFHTSSSSPYFAPGAVGSSYPISIFGSSNDLSLKIQTVGTPATNTTLFSLINGNQTLTIAMSATKKVEVKLNALVITTGVDCGDGKISLYMTKGGKLTLVTSHNSIITSAEFLLDFSQVTPFVTGLIGIPLESRFGDSFGLRELSVFKQTPVYVESTTPLPMIVYQAPVIATPLSGTVSVNGFSPYYQTIPGYYLYLTLTGTWAGTVRLQKTVDFGVNWYTVTVQGGDPLEITKNCDEAVLMISDPKARYRLQFILTSGSVKYRLAQ